MKLRVISLYSIFLVLMSLILVIMGIGFRPESIGSDTFGYMKYYNGLLESLGSEFRYDFLFEIVARCCAYLKLSKEWYLTFFALINGVSLILIARHLSKYFLEQVTFYRILFLMITLLCISPFFFGSQVNVLRQGTSTFLLFLYYLLLIERSPLILLAVTAFCAIGFHLTAAIYIFLSPLVFITYMSVMRLTLLISIFYLTGAFRYFIYLSSVGLYNKIIIYGAFSGYRVGIRYAFTLFTLGVGYGFYLLGNYFLRDLDQKRFFYLLKIYWILTIPFFILGFGAYSDRYLLPVWVYISILGASFITLFMKRYNLSIYWYYVVFFVSSIYFLLKTQGIIG